MLSTAITLLAAAASPATASPDVPTFVDVAPIVHAKCTSCHRPGAAGPFPLRTYREVAKRGPMIAFVLEDGLMPPWHPVEGHGAFKDSLALGPGQLETLIAWIDGGMPEGDTSKIPEAPEFSAGWQLGEPDLVVTMTRPFEVPASGADLYRNFAVPIPTDEDKWLTAIEVRAGAPRVLHHIVFDIDTRGRGRKLSGSDGRSRLGCDDRAGRRRRWMERWRSPAGNDPRWVGCWAAGPPPTDGAGTQASQGQRSDLALAFSPQRARRI